MSVTRTAPRVYLHAERAPAERLAAELRSLAMLPRLVRRSAARKAEARYELAVARLDAKHGLEWSESESRQIKRGLGVS